SDVCCDRVIEQENLLRNIANAPLPCPHSSARDGCAVYAELPLLRLQQAQDDVHDGSLAGARATDEADGRIGRDRQVEVAQRRSLSFGIFVVDFLQLQCALQANRLAWRRAVRASGHLVDHEICMQRIESGTPEAYLRKRAVYLLQSREEPGAGKRENRHQREHRYQFLGTGRHQNQEDRHDTSEGQRFESEPRQLTDNLTARLAQGIFTSRPLELANALLLAPEDFDVLDPSQRLLRHLKALPIRSSAIDTDSAEILAKSNVDEEVIAAKDDDGSQRHFRLQRDNQSNEKQCHDEIRNELEKRQQHLI